MDHSDSPLALHGGTPVRTDKFSPRWSFGGEERAQLMEVMDRADTSWRHGLKVQEFASKLQTLYEVAHAIPTGSGSAAVHAAIGALNPNPGQEVITTAATDIGSHIGILQHNLIPIFVDWDEATFNMDPEQIEARITSRTCAILVVHLFGNPCAMDRIMEIARKHGIPVIEDCSQAHLAMIGGRKVGSIGDLGCFSMGLKTITTDQGGFVATNDPALAARARGFLNKGGIFDENGAWEPYARLGVFYPMSDLQAAIGVAQLGKLEAANEARIRTAAILDEAFAGLAGFTVPKLLPGARHTYFVYPFHVDEQRTRVSLGDFLHALRAEGIPDVVGPYLNGKPLTKFSVYANAQTYGDGGYPFREESGAVRIDYSEVSLPVLERLLPGVGLLHMRNRFVAEEAHDIATAIRKVARYYGWRQ